MDFLDRDCGADTERRLREDPTPGLGILHSQKWTRFARFARDHGIDTFLKNRNRHRLGWDP